MYASAGLSSATYHVMCGATGPVHCACSLYEVLLCSKFAAALHNIFQLLNSVMLLSLLCWVCCMRLAGRVRCCCAVSLLLRWLSSTLDSHPTARSCTYHGVRSRHARGDGGRSLQGHTTKLCVMPSCAEWQVHIGFAQAVKNNSVLLYLLRHQAALSGSRTQPCCLEGSCTTDIRTAHVMTAVRG